MAEPARHDPAAGIYGDCHRRALAYLLRLPPEEVPHFADGLGDADAGEQYRRVRAWLQQRGLHYVVLPCVGGVEQAMQTMAESNPGVHYLLSGEGGAGCGHVVVCKDAEFVFGGRIVAPDPDSGLVWIELLVPAHGKEAP